MIHCRGFVWFSCGQILHMGYSKKHPSADKALLFLVVAIVAAIFGFGGIAGAAAGIAQFLFVVFVILFVISLIFGRRPPTLN